VTRLKWKLDSVRLEIVLTLMQGSERFVPNIPQAQKLLWMHPMEHLDDVDHVECCFGPFGDSVSVSARWVNALRLTYHNLINCFGRTRWHY
jgi:hypothetical protein